MITETLRTEMQMSRHLENDKFGSQEICERN